MVFSLWGSLERRAQMLFTHLASPKPLSAAKVLQDKFDVTLLHTKPEVAARERMVDDGNGKVQVMSPATRVPGQAGPRFSWLLSCRGAHGLLRLLCFPRHLRGPRTLP